jgi:membrane-bound lytic murein transglycosylase MltF
MVVAQGYQESMLNQSARSPGGAVGIHAGVKLLNSIATDYFNDPKIDSTNRLLFTFAAYNCGPNCIAELRRRAPSRVLDPNKWFGNVELLVEQSAGPVTVQYVISRSRTMATSSCMRDKWSAVRIGSRRPALSPNQVAGVVWSCAIPSR